MSNNKMSINISGGTSHIGNILQGDNNSLNNGIDSPKSEQIFEAIDSLRQAIESDKLLSQIQRQAAISDLSCFSEEVKKPSEQQSPETKKFFWERLTEILKISSSLISVSTAVAKLAGFI